MLKVVHVDAGAATNTSTGGSLLDEIAREGARQMLAAAMTAEAADYVQALVGEVDEYGHRLVVRKRLPRRAGGGDRGGRDTGAAAAGQRPTC